MGIGSLKIQKAAVNQSQPGNGIDAGNPLVSNLDSQVTPAGLTSNNFYGIVGGSISAVQTLQYSSTVSTTAGSSAYPIILVSANVGSGATNARIVLQKGSSKFLVSNVFPPIVSRTCVLVNSLSGALNVGEMRIVINNGTSNIALKRLTNKYGIGFDGNRYFLNFFAASVDKTSLISIVSRTLGNGTTINLKFAATQPFVPFAVGSTVTVSGYVTSTALNGNWVVQSCTTGGVTIFNSFTGPVVAEPAAVVGQITTATVLKSGAVASTWTSNDIGAIPMVQVPKQP